MASGKEISAFERPGCLDFSSDGRARASQCCSGDPRFEPPLWLRHSAEHEPLSRERLLVPKVAKVGEGCMERYLGGDPPESSPSIEPDGRLEEENLKERLGVERPEILSEGLSGMPDHFGRAGIPHDPQNLGTDPSGPIRASFGDREELVLEGSDPDPFLLQGGSEPVMFSDRFREREGPFVQEGIRLEKAKDHFDPGPMDHDFPQGAPFGLGVSSLESVVLGRKRSNLWILAGGRLHGFAGNRSPAVRRLLGVVLCERGLVPASVLGSSPSEAAGGIEIAIPQGVQPNPDRLPASSGDSLEIFGAFLRGFRT